MKAEFTAIIEPTPEGGYWAICLEIPGANGQGETIEEVKSSLIEAIKLILEDRKERGRLTLSGSIQKMELLKRFRDIKKSKSCWQKKILKNLNAEY